MIFSRMTALVVLVFEFEVSHRRIISTSGLLMAYVSFIRGNDIRNILFGSVRPVVDKVRL